MYALLHHYQKETETIYLHIVHVRTDGQTNELTYGRVCVQVRKTIQLQ